MWPTPSTSLTPTPAWTGFFNFGIHSPFGGLERGVQEIARVLKAAAGFYFEEIYPPLYANPLFRHLLDHPTENRFHVPSSGALSGRRFGLAPRVPRDPFGIVGVAVKERIPHAS